MLKKLKDWALKILKSPVVKKLSSPMVIMALGIMLIGLRVLMMVRFGPTDRNIFGLLLIAGAIALWLFITIITRHIKKNRPGK